MTQIIDNFAALPLGVWLDILAVNADESREEVDKQVATLHLLTGMPERDILNLPIYEYSELARKADFLGVAPVRYARTARKYTLGGFTLIPTSDLRKITAAQYIDFQTFAPGGDKNLVEILSVFLVPEGKDYNDGYDVLEVQDAIRAELSVEQAVALCAFFLSKYAALIKGTTTSLFRLMKREKDKVKRERIAAKIAELKAAGASLIGGAGLQT